MAPGTAAILDYLRSSAIALGLATALCPAALAAWSAACLERLSECARSATATDLAACLRKSG